MIKHTSPISGIAVHSDCYIATAGYDNRLILWNAKTRASLACGFHDHLVNECRFSQSGAYLVSSSSDHSARVWSLPDLKLISVLGEHSDDVTSSAIFEPLDLIATACQDGIVRVFHRSGRLIKDFRGHSKCVNSVEWANDGKTLISSSNDNSIIWWDYESGKTLKIMHADTEVDSVAISDRGVFIGDDDGKIHFVGDGVQIETVAHNSGIKRLSINAEKTRLVSLSYDRSLCVFAIDPASQSLELLKRTEFPDLVWPRTCAFLGKTNLVLGTFGSSYALFDLTTGSWDLTSVKSTNGINGVLCRDGDVFTAGDDGIVRLNGGVYSQHQGLLNFVQPFKSELVCGGQTGALYSCTTGTLLYQHFSPINFGSEFITPEGETLFVIGTYTGECVFLRRNSQYCEVVRSIRVQDNAIKSLKVIGYTILTASATGAIVIYDFCSEAVKILGQHESVANACDSLPDGRGITVSRDRTMRIWHGTQEALVPTPHSHSVKSLRASPNGDLIATGAYNGAVAIYDVKAQTWLTIQRPTSFGISSIDWDEQSRNFVAASFDGKCYRINLRNSEAGNVA